MSVSSTCRRVLQNMAAKSSTATATKIIAPRTAPGTVEEKRGERPTKTTEIAANTTAISAGRIRCTARHLADLRAAGTFDVSGPLNQPYLGNAQSRIFRCSADGVRLAGCWGPVPSSV